MLQNSTSCVWSGVETNHGILALALTLTLTGVSSIFFGFRCIQTYLHPYILSQMRIQKCFMRWNIFSLELNSGWESDSGILQCRACWWMGVTSLARGELQLVARGSQATLLNRIFMSARPLAFLVLLFACSVKDTTGQDGAELAATALHSRLAKYDSNFRPGYGGAPLEVAVRVRQLAVGESGEVSIQLGVAWQDLRLAHEVEGVEEIRFSLNSPGACFLGLFQALWRQGVGNLAT